SFIDISGKSAIFFFTTLFTTAMIKTVAKRLPPAAVTCRRRRHLNLLYGGDAMSSKSTRSRRSRKGPADQPKKPYPAFPLSPHASGAWQKKIRGKIYYFGHWARRVKGKLTRIEGDGWKEALELYSAQADDLHAGRSPRAKSGEPTLGYLCNLFLTAKLRRLGLPDKDIKELADLPTSEWLPVLAAKAGAGHRISPRMCQEYKSTVDRLVDKFGKNRLIDDLRPEDFASLGNDLAKQYGPVRRGNEIQMVRTVFKFAFDNDLIKTPVRFGSEFKKPDTTELRKHRAENGEKMLEAADLRKLIKAASVPVKAMLLLGVNGGFGNHDVATLPMSALDLDRGWINYPRPKTGIPRRCPLWPETVEALRTTIAERPEPQQEEA